MLTVSTHAAACCSLQLVFFSIAKVLKSGEVKNLIGGQSERIIMNGSIVCFGRR